MANENASFHNFINREHKKLLAVHPNIERAKAAELVFAVQKFQANAPRGKWKHRKGRKSLYRSIVIDPKEAYVHTEKRFEVLEDGGVVRSRGRWLPVPIRGRVDPFGKAGYFALPERRGQRVVVSRRGRGARRIVGVFKRQVTIPRIGWERRAREDIARARRDEVIADKVLPLG